MGFRIAFKNRIVPLRLNGTALKDIPEEYDETPNSDDDNADPQYPFISILSGQTKEEEANAQLY